MKKRITALLLSASLLTSFSASAFAMYEDSVPFQDVGKDGDFPWYFSYVVKAYEDGLMLGTSETMFEPNIGMTREMFVTALVRLAGANPSHDIAPTFVDVHGGKWYAPAIAWAQQNGIVKGVDENHFGLGQLVTREQAAVMLSNYIQSQKEISLQKTGDPTDAFSDSNTISSWAKDAVEEMRAYGILCGDENDCLNPKKSMTRAECATMLVRYTMARTDNNQIPLSVGDLTSVEWNAMTYNKEYVISDEKDIRALIDYIKAAPVVSKTLVEMPRTGFTFLMDFKNGNNYVETVQFGESYITFGYEGYKIGYTVQTDYFKPLIDVLLKDGKPIN